LLPPEVATPSLLNVTATVGVGFGPPELAGVGVKPVNAWLFIYFRQSLCEITLL
jgi:hypothetical protein